MPCVRISRVIEQSGIDYVLILSGDQLYRMDYQKMLQTHINSQADVTIATVPLSSEQASAFGIMRVNDEGRVEGFLEKPQTEEDLAMVRTSRTGLISRASKVKAAIVWPAWAFICSTEIYWLIY